MKKRYGCKKFRVSHYPEPSTGFLPVERTTQNLPLKIIGIDYACSSMCKTKRCKETKVYILLFTCSLTRAINLELLPNQLTQEFIIALKRLITNAGRATVIYSDNAKTFVVASKWSGKVNKDEKMQEHLIKELIKRNFNLSRKPCLGGQLERTVGIVKEFLFKATGKKNLTAPLN